jgi:hypothetical protein
MLELPDVTLVLIDNVAQELSAISVWNALQKIEPKETLIFSHKPTFDLPGLKWVKPAAESWVETLWKEVPKFIETSHYLVLQWDSGVLNPEAWNPDFLRFDYIGAPWPWHKTYSVGNGGFSLRSKRLGETLANMPTAVVPTGINEDDYLCRHMQSYLVKTHGFKWASAAVASYFSIEHGNLIADAYPFGFHDCRNWPFVLEKADLNRRIELGKANPYISSKYEFQALLNYVSAS